MPSVKRENARSRLVLTRTLWRTGAVTGSMVVVSVVMILLELFRFLPERAERLVPELIQVLSQGVEALDLEGVEAPGPLCRVRHELRILEHAEMLRDRGPADRELPGELPDCERTVREPGQDFPSCG